MKFRETLVVVAAFSILSGSASAQAAEPEDTEDRVQTAVDKGLAYLATPLATEVSTAMVVEVECTAPIDLRLLRLLDRTHRLRRLRDSRSHTH